MGRRSLVAALVAIAVLVLALAVLERTVLAPTGQPEPSPEAGEAEVAKPGSREELLALAEARGQPVFVEVWSAY